MRASAPTAAQVSSIGCLRKWPELAVRCSLLRLPRYRWRHRGNINCPYAVDSNLSRQRGRNMKPTDNRTIQKSGRLIRLLIVASALVLATSAVAQVPVQDRKELGAPLRPAVMGPSGGVSAGHPLTAAVAFSILLKGGNAFDAGVASLLAGGVLEQDLYSLGGEALVLVYPRREGKVTSIVGQGWAPHAVDVDWYLTRNKTLSGHGLDPAVVPGALHAALTVLEKWGTMSFEQVATPAIDYAEKGFPIRPSTVNTIRRERAFIEQWPANKAYWYKPDGSPYSAGDTIKLPTLARTLRRMVEAERARKGAGRAAGIVAARDRFYKGDIAREMVAFLRQHDAPFDESDFADYFARIEEPAHTTYRGYTIYKHGFSQPGADPPPDPQYPGEFRSPCDGLRQRRLPAHRHRSAEAGLRRPRHLLRRPGLREISRRRPAVEGLRQRARSAHRSKAGLNSIHRRRSHEVRFAGQDLVVLESQRS